MRSGTRVPYNRGPDSPMGPPSSLSTAEDLQTPARRVPSRAHPLRRTPQWTTALLVLLSLVLMGCSRHRADGRVRVIYWEKWSGAEASAMQQPVDAFNASQDRIFVEFLSGRLVFRKRVCAK